MAAHQRPASSKFGDRQAGTVNILRQSTPQTHRGSAGGELVSACSPCRASESCSTDMNWLPNSGLLAMAFSTSLRLTFARTCATRRRPFRGAARRARRAGGACRRAAIAQSAVRGTGGFENELRERRREANGLPSHLAGLQGCSHGRCTHHGVAASWSWTAESVLLLGLQRLHQNRLFASFRGSLRG